MHGSVHGLCMAWCRGGGGVGGGDVVGVEVDFCLGIIPGLVRLDSSIGGGLVGDGVEVVGVVL